MTETSLSSQTKLTFSFCLALPAWLCPLPFGISSFFFKGYNFAFLFKKLKWFVGLWFPLVLVMTYEGSIKHYLRH